MKKCGDSVYALYFYECPLIVIADSFVGSVALQYDFEEICFPSVPETVSSDLWSTSESIPSSENPLLGNKAGMSRSSSNESHDTQPEGSGFYDVCRIIKAD